MTGRTAGLATSGKRWGLSCEVGNEAQMGVILGYMKLLGADNIGFDVVASPQRRSPARSVAAGKTKKGKKVGRPKGSRSHSRKPLMEDARDFLKTLSNGDAFTAADFHGALHRWSLSARSRALLALVTGKEVKRTKGRGNYVRSFLKLVKPAA